MRSEELTEQDRRLLTLLQKNLRDDQIASVLYVGERTMQRQLKRLMERLGACNRFSLGVKAATLGLVAPDDIRRATSSSSAADRRLRDDGGGAEPRGCDPRETAVPRDPT